MAIVLRESESLLGLKAVSKRKDARDARPCRNARNFRPHSRSSNGW